MTFLKIGLLVAVVAAVAVLSGLMLGKPRGSQFDRAGLATRKAIVVEHQIAQIDGDYALIVGDSIVERARLGSVCGLPVVTAGVSGSTLEELQSLFERIAKMRPPKLLVLAAGINSFRNPGTGDAAKWEASFLASLETLDRVSAVVALIDSDDVDSDAVRNANQIIRRHAEERNYAVVPAISAELTLDGVHPSAAGYAVWAENLGQSCVAR